MQDRRVDYPTLLSSSLNGSETRVLLLSLPCSRLILLHSLLQVGYLSVFMTHNVPEPMPPCPSKRMVVWIVQGRTARVYNHSHDLKYSFPAHVRYWLLSVRNKPSILRNTLPRSVGILPPKAVSVLSACTACPFIRKIGVRRTITGILFLATLSGGHGGHMVSQATYKY